MSKFTANFFKGNRARIANITKADVIVITANGQLQRNSDCAFPFRQDSNFWYLTGLELSDATLVIDLKNNNEWLILSEKSEYELLFDSQLENETVKSISGIEGILAHKEGWDKLGKLLKASCRVATNAAPPEFIDVYGIYTNPTRKILCERLLSYSGVKLIDLRSMLANLRVFKQTIEIETMRKAIEVTCQALTEVKNKLPEYLYEREIEVKLTSDYRLGGTRGHAFTPIVASGANACVLHYHENNDPLANNQLIVIDTGAELNNYSADITRTYVKGTITSRQLDVYRAVYEAQLAGLEFMKPGNLFKDVDDALNSSLEKSLGELGLKPIGDKSLLRSYYPHASHYLGLDVHDVGDRDLPLEEGMVWTIEPGIYIPQEGIGIRIEDDILITKKGHENLSQQLASSPQELFGK